MKRREFLKVAGAGIAGATVAAPAIAQSKPEVKWRLTSSFPKSLDTLYGAAETISKYVSDATDGKFQIQVFASDEIVPSLQAADAVTAGTVEACHTAAYYRFGKDPTWALFCSVPFGLNARQQNAWFYEGDGMKLMNEFTKASNIISFPAGNTGAQMGGWFRKEIKEVSDLKALKFRIGGLGGRVMQKLGCVPQQIPGGEIYAALEKGTIDAAEWVGPHDDEKLGFYKVAKFYHYPGWWEAGTALHLMVNTAAWDKLPKNYKAIVSAAAGYANVKVLARYDARNPAALKRLIAAGVQLRPFSAPVLEACFKATSEVFNEISVANANFKKVFENMQFFRTDERLWWEVAEFTNFMIRTQRRR